MAEADYPIQISVNTEFLHNRLPDEKQKYAFAYHITIVNAGDTDVQLLNRYWLITDANGKTSEVQGAGVVGEQPVIPPGQKYQYTSGAILDTPVGSMQGYYEMQSTDGETFRAPIDVFSLAVPNLIN